MNKAQSREYDKALALLGLPHYVQQACRTLAVLQREVNKRDQATIEALIVTRGLTEHFAKVNGCLVAH